MSATVFAAIILAALLHAGWNAMVKGGGDKATGMGAVSLGHIPIGLVVLAVFPWPAAESLPWLIASALLHLGYQVFLVNAYRVGDLTQVYPLARGFAPMAVALVSVTVLGVVLTGMELLAIAVIGIGLISLGLTRHADGLRNGKATILALTTGGFIAAYSLVDGMGARASGSPIAFFGASAILTSLLMAGHLWRFAPASLRAIPTRGRTAFFVGGTASFAAYGLVVWGFTQAPIALVTALRETSIVFALLIGVFAMGERLSLTKLVSTMLTLLGAILLRFAR